MDEAATDPSDGLVWRVEPGPRPLTRSIAVGPGVASLAFAGGALWATSFVDGTVARIDPRTDGRPDPRPDVRERAPQLGNLVRDFDFSQKPRPPFVLTPR